MIVSSYCYPKCGRVLLKRLAVVKDNEGWDGLDDYL
ncbi:hypothetical protein MHA_2444 [Mannheimia haemolytica PHL213]|nr:hypothetical protein MHA_2444 [Mannheimia haemolytica PHL213]